MSPTSDTDRTLPCRCGHDDTVHARTGARSWACTTPDCACTDYTTPHAGYIEAAVRLGREPRVWPWDHLPVTTPAGVLTCVVCGPLGPGQYVQGVDHRGTDRPLCVHWQSPAPTPAEVAAMNCPPWCDPDSHTRDDHGRVETDCHSSDKYGAVSILREDTDGVPGEVRLVVYADPYEGIGLREARQLVADILEAAGAVEAAAMPRV